MCNGLSELKYDPSWEQWSCPICDRYYETKDVLPRLFDRITELEQLVEEKEKSINALQLSFDELLSSAEKQAVAIDTITTAMRSNQEYVEKLKADFEIHQEMVSKYLNNLEWDLNRKEMEKGIR